VTVSQDEACLTIGDASLPPETTRVTIVDPASQRTLIAVVVAPSESCARGEDGQSAMRGYRVRVEGAAPPTPLFGIAIVSAPAFKTIGGSTVADIDGDGRDEFFRACTSTEGIHLTIWSDRPLTGALRWHRYHYLGYDVTPSCTTEETRAP